MATPLSPGAGIPIERRAPYGQAPWPAAHERRRVLPEASIDISPVSRVRLSNGTDSAGARVEPIDGVNGFAPAGEQPAPAFYGHPQGAVQRITPAVPRANPYTSPHAYAPTRGNGDNLPPVEPLRGHAAREAMQRQARVLRATLHRMVMPGHVCPYGLKALHLLHSRGYQVDDQWLTSRDDQEAFKARLDVPSTPQVFIGGKRIGGYDDLRRHFGLAVQDPEAKSYGPVIALFVVAALMAIATGSAVSGVSGAPGLSGIPGLSGEAGDAAGIFTARTLVWLVSFAMCLLALQKLQDVESFSTAFLGYDLLARKYVPYSYAYPYAELLAGVLMAAGMLPWISGPVAIFIGSIGTASVFQAVVIERRAVRCACVGGNSRVPLGLPALLENGMMVAIGAYTLSCAMTELAT